VTFRTTDEYSKTAKHNDRGGGVITSVLALVCTELRITSDFFQAVAEYLGPKYEEGKKKGSNYLKDAQDTAGEYAKAGQDKFNEISKAGQKNAEQLKGDAKKLGDQAKGKAEDLKGDAQNAGEQAKGKAEEVKGEAKKATK
jgi:CRISPR/Cas system CSM-associated protein Csm4 (group 5 of RAMP superfamily)